MIKAFFFFQAEDGIRDYKVTGVQTCALPIWGGQSNKFDWVSKQSIKVIGVLSIIHAWSKLWSLDRKSVV